MSLTPCMECQKDISTDARTCPNCGKRAPHKKKAKISTGSTFWLIFLVLMGLVGITRLDSSPDEPAVPAQPEKPDFGFISSVDAEVICRDKVTEMSKYPSSVKIIDSHAYKNNDGTVLSTVEFTAMNSLGAELPLQGECRFNKNGNIKVRTGNR